MGLNTVTFEFETGYYHEDTVESKIVPKVNLSSQNNLMEMFYECTSNKKERYYLNHLLFL